MSQIIVPTQIDSQTVIGPNSSTVGDIAIWNNTTGTLLADSGVAFPIPANQGGTGQTSYSTGDILYASGSTTLSKLSASSDGSFVQDYGGVPISANPTNRFYFYDDAMLLPAYDSHTSGTASTIVSAVLDNQHPGCVQFETGTDTTGKVSLSVGGSGAQTGFVIFGGGTWTLDFLINIPTLANVTDDYYLVLGFQDQWIFSGSVNNGVYFTYNRSTSPNWIINTSNGGVQTNTTTSTAVSTGWTHLKIVSTIAPLHTFYVNGVSVGTINTNTPTGSTGLTFSIFKTAGTTNTSFYMDYIQASCLFTSSRS